MHTIFNVYPNHSQQRLEQTYLMILALLNFDHEVTLIFHCNSFHELSQIPEQLKKWQSLVLYGAEDFLHFNGDHDSVEKTQLEHLMHSADFIA